VTRCYLDTNYLYSHLRQPSDSPDSRLRAWRRRVADELGTDAAVISALVLDELAYRTVIAWLKDDGDPDPLAAFRSSGFATMRRMRVRFTRLWEGVEMLGCELAVTERHVTGRALRLMTDPGMPPRDAFHAAHAIAAGCSVIVSSDRGFDELATLRRLGPT
jgi:predicted nucleic acid-binding protein